MTRRRADPRVTEPRPPTGRRTLAGIEAMIAEWPEEEARMGLLVLGSWLAGDMLTLRRAWLRLSPYRIGWLSQVMKEIDPGLPTS